MEQKPFAVRYQFGDVDELGEVTRAWGVDFRQLDRGRLEGSVAQWADPSMQLGRVTLSRRIDQRGAPPRELRTFAIPADPAMRLNWRGRHVTGSQVLVFPLGGELECVSAPGFDMLIVSVAPELLDDAACRIGLSGFARLLREHEVLTLPPLALDVLRGEVAWRLHAAVARPGEHDTQVHDEIPSLLVQGVGAGMPHERESTRSPRARLVRQAVELIHERDHHLLTMSELCRLVGVTERSLQRGFKELVGVSPKQYLLAHRLSGVHRMLHHADPTRTRVVDAADEWGFWHMGQLAADYRRHFGEKPSQTLRRRADR